MKRFVPVLVERLQATRLQLLDVYGTPSLSATAMPHAADPMAAARRARAPRAAATPPTSGRSTSSRGDGVDRFAPGQFNMLYAFGVGEVPISISGDPADAGPARPHDPRRRRGHRRRCAELKPGDALGVRGPFGIGWPVERSRGHDVVFVAGGLGLAPLRPAIYHVLADRERYGRVVLLYGARSPDDILFRTRARSAGGGGSTSTSRSPSTTPIADWRGHVGVVTDADPARRFDPAHTIAHGLRAGGDDALRRRRAGATRASPTTRSTSRWSAT